MANSSDLPIEETSRLIASNRVEGTTVYSREGDKLGSVYNFMVDKASGQVAYAVLVFGGFLGIGQSYHPLPWTALRYDKVQDGYVVNLDKRVLEGGPSFKASEPPTFDQAYTDRVSSYYGMQGR